MINKVIIPAAGLGTRLFPATKEQPKEMLPVFCKTKSGSMAVKPIVQLVFEQLYDAELREFCFVVGRGKRSIEDHFTPDKECIRNLEGKGKNGQATDLNDFYAKLETTTAMWVNQPQPKGFGNADLLAEPFVQNEQCMVHAGDGYILSQNMDYAKRLLEMHKRFNADAAFLVLEIDNPKQYGIVEGKEETDGVIKVESVVEKPDRPKTKLAIMAIYTFKPIIFEALKATLPGKNGESQLTDAIQKLIDWNYKVYALKLDKNYERLDIGTPEVYWEALKVSHRGCFKIHKNK
jgi:UTP--glucose-1-phosphate uridylyltransferase